MEVESARIAMPGRPPAPPKNEDSALSLVEVPVHHDEGFDAQQSHRGVKRRRTSKDCVETDKVEPRNRDRTNAAFADLQNLIPLCVNPEERTMDKLDILERTIEYLHYLERNFGTIARRAPDTPGAGIAHKKMQPSDRVNFFSGYVAAMESVGNFIYDSKEILHSAASNEELDDKVMRGYNRFSSSCQKYTEDMRGFGMLLCGGNHSSREGSLPMEAPDSKGRRGDGKAEIHNPHAPNGASHYKGGRPGAPQESRQSNNGNGAAPRSHKEPDWGYTTGVRGLHHSSEWSYESPSHGGVVRYGGDVPPGGRGQVAFPGVWMNREGHPVAYAGGYGYIAVHPHMESWRRGGGGGRRNSKDHLSSRSSGRTDSSHREDSPGRDDSPGSGEGGPEANTAGIPYSLYRDKKGGEPPAHPGGYYVQAPHLRVVPPLPPPPQSSSNDHVSSSAQMSQCMGDGMPEDTTRAPNGIRDDDHEGGKQRIPQSLSSASGMDLLTAAVEESV